MHQAFWGKIMVAQMRLTENGEFSAYNRMSRGKRYFPSRKDLIRQSHPSVQGSWIQLPITDLSIPNRVTATI